MKTAVQQLISDLENFKTLPIMTEKQIYSIDACIGFAELALKKEREQLISAHCNGQDITDTAGVSDAEKYLSETYTTN